MLDLLALGFTHAESKTTGRPSYNPADLLKLYIYGYLNCIRSSRKLEKECLRNVEVMWLLKKLAPDHKTIADFRKNNPDSIKKVFKEFVFFCKEPGLYGGEVVAIDGSKFKAVNSKKRNLNEDKLVNTGESQVSLTDPDSRMMMNNQNKEVLEVESLDVLSDKGYYNAEEIKKCVENNTIPYIPEPKPKQPKEESIPKPGFYDSDFKYDASKDVYTCPEGRELTFSVISKKNDKMMKEYRTDSCSSCECKSKCTRNKKGRVIFRWEHEEILDDMS